MRVGWAHTFRNRNSASGIFMYRAAEEMRRLGVDPVLIDLQSLGPGIGPIRSRVRRELSGFELVHAQYGSGCGFAVGWASCSTCITLRGSDWYGLEGPGILRVLHGRMAVKLTRSCLRHYRRIFVASRRMAEEVSSVAPTASVEVMPSGIDLKVFRPRARREARRALGFADLEAFVVLFASAHPQNPIKRADLARSAVASARRRDPSIRFVEVTGVDPKHMPLIVSAADVILLTSVHEGWPNIIKEGLACNVPFVSTDVSDLSAIADTCSTCHVVDPRPEAIAGAILDLRSDPRTGSEDLRHFVESMDLTATCRRLIEVYEEISGKPSP